MEYNKLVPGILIKRKNRFMAEVSLMGQEYLAHVPNSGRLEELMRPGARVYLNPQRGKKRKTMWDIVLVRGEKGFVAIDSRIATTLFAEALKEGKLPELTNTKIDKSEVALGNSRLDFQLQTPQGLMWVEVKSVNLVRNGAALFPDAPTERGARHIDELIGVQQKGEQCLLFFSVQREDGEFFSPHQEMDPVFSEKVRQAYEAGVKILAYKSKIEFPYIYLAEKLPLKIY